MRSTSLRINSKLATDVQCVSDLDSGGVRCTGSWSGTGKDRRLFHACIVSGSLVDVLNGMRNRSRLRQTDHLYRASNELAMRLGEQSGCIPAFHDNIGIDVIRPAGTVLFLERRLKAIVHPKVLPRNAAYTLLQLDVHLSCHPQ